MRALAAVLAIAATLPACGKRGDPLPPLPRTPQAVGGFTVAQRADVLEVAMVAPRLTTGGEGLGVVEIELLRLDGPGEIEKGRKQTFRAAPGERIVESFPLPAPGTPVKLAARARHRGQVSNTGKTLTITVQAPPPPRVRLYRSGPGGEPALLVPAPVSGTTFEDPGATQGQAWCYRARLVTSAEPLVESADSPEACLEVKDVFPPAAPTGLTALLQEGEVEVSWSPSSDADLASYRLYRASEGAAPQRVAEVPADRTSVRDAPAAGALHVYTLTAVDGKGNESAPSAPAEVRRP